MSYYIVEIKGENKKLINEDSYQKFKKSLSKPVFEINKNIYDKFLFVRCVQIEYENLEKEIIKLSDYWKRTFKADLLNYSWELNSKTISNMFEKAKKL